MNRENIRRTLILRAGGGDSDPKSIAKAAISTWRDASTRLSPVVGGQGIDVLLRRSLHVAGKTHPLLAAEAHESRNTLLASLEMRLASSEMSLAVEASNALLLTFTELLSSLIGESLSERLLAPIWAPPLPASEHEGAP